MPAAVDRVLAGMVEGDQLVVLLVVGEVEPGRDLHRLERDLPRALEPGHQRRQLPLPRRPVPAADLDVDRVHLAPAHDRHQLVPGLLELERACHDVRVVARELDRARVSEEVGGVQHEDVKRVALDPLPAVEEPAERLQLAADLHAAGHLHRRHRAHLVRHRADPADPGGDVGDLGEAAPAQERLEEPGRLVDVELDLLDLAARDPHEHRALALDPGQRVGLDRLRAPLGHPGRLSSNARTLNVRKTRSTALSPIPRASSSRVSAAMLGDSIGPKHP